MKQKVLQSLDRAYIARLAEPDMGGHYYAHAPESADWTSASFLTSPNECQVCGIDGKRRAFICLGLRAEEPGRQCDVGLANDGGFWYPMSYCPGACLAEAEHVYVRAEDGRFPIPEHSAVRITLRFWRETGDDWVRGEFHTDGTLAAAVTYRAPAGTLLGGQDRPQAAFLRFMSLCPLEGVSKADGSSLTGTIRELRLGGSSWQADRIAHAWIMDADSVPYCQISTLSGSEPCSDRVRIFHQRRPVNGQAPSYVTTQGDSNA